MSAKQDQADKQQDLETQLMQLTQDLHSVEAHLAASAKRVAISLPQVEMVVEDGEDGLVSSAAGRTSKDGRLKVIRGP